MKRFLPVIFVSFTLLLFSFLFPPPVSAQGSFGFNIHSLAKDTPGNIANILNYLATNCQTNIVRIFGFEGWGGYDNIQKVLNAAPPGMKFIIALEDFPYGPALNNPGAWFGGGYRNSYRPYVQRVVSRYAGDPRILVWEIMNEPHCKGDTGCLPALYSFMQDISQLIKSIDPSTHVSPGFMGGHIPWSEYERINNLPGITATSCHYNSDVNNVGTCLEAANHRGSTSFFYVGEAGYMAPGPAPDGSCTSPGCQNMCDAGTLQQRAATIQADMGQLAGVADAFLIWQFSPEGSPFLICDKFSVFPGDPVCQIGGFLPYVIPPGPYPPPYPPTGLTCTPEISGDPDSRPVRCDACNRTSLYTSSCATSFTVLDEVTYRRGDSDFRCPEPDGDHWLERDWGGIVTVDPSQTEIPFVGKKGLEDERKYLADYFEGTGFYYRPPYDYSNPDDIQRVILEGGVWRKLAPEEWQDKFKRDIVYRSLMSLAGNINEGAIHDYFVSYNGESAKLSEFIDHLKPYPDEENYQEKYDEWVQSDGGKWYRLWAALPMFSREDTPGQILPYLGMRIKDSFVVLNPEAQIDKIPHLARLYEATQAINYLLLPSAQQANGAEARIKTFIAAAKDGVLGEKVEIKSNQTATTNPNKEESGQERNLLAQGGSCLECPELSIVNPFVSNGMLYYTYVLCRSCYKPGDGPLGDIFMAPCGGGAQMHNIDGACFSTMDPSMAPPVAISCPGTATVCVSFKCDNCSGCPGTWNSATCSVTVDDKCNIAQTDCGAGWPPDRPTCGLPEPWPVAACAKESITDPNPNDDICGTPISIELSAVDQFVNSDYIECGVECLEWNEVTGECKKDACDEEKSHGVERDVGVNLLHPYLYEIWGNSTEALTGFFNIIRPKQAPEFEELDANSEIYYGYSSGGVMPSVGNFYYPYLGGIQKAKEWVINALNPL